VVIELFKVRNQVPLLQDIGFLKKFKKNYNRIGQDLFMNFEAISIAKNFKDFK